MKNTTVFLVALAAAFYLGGSPAWAQGRNGGGAPGTVHGASSTHGTNPKGEGGKDASSAASRKAPIEMLTHNTRLASKLQTLLSSKVVGPSPAPYATMEAAAQGFKNVGQFVAAVHVSHNLGIPFADVKAKMMYPHAESLGKAIHDLKPDVDAKAEAKKAQKEANKDLKESSS